MSISGRQGTCAACGGVLGNELVLETLIDDAVRWVAVHPGHSTIVGAGPAPAPIPIPDPAPGGTVVTGPWLGGGRTGEAGLQAA